MPKNTHSIQVKNLTIWNTADNVKGKADDAHWRTPSSYKGLRKIVRTGGT